MPETYVARCGEHEGVAQRTPVLTARSLVTVLKEAGHRGPTRIEITQGGASFLTVHGEDPDHALAEVHIMMTRNTRRYR